MTTRTVSEPLGPGQLQLTAFHEAGHAVLSFLRDQVVLGASVVRTTDSLGHIEQEAVLGRPTPRCDPALRDRVLTQIEVLLAGPAAEAQRLALVENSDDLLGRAVALFERTAAGEHDLKEATRLAKAISFSATEAKYLVHFLHRRVAGRFSTNRRIWHAVETLAVALVEHGEVHGSHVHWVIRRALAGKSYLDVRERLAVRIRTGPTIFRVGVAAKVRRLST